MKILTAVIMCLMISIPAMANDPVGGPFVTEVIPSYHCVGKHPCTRDNAPVVRHSHQVKHHVHHTRHHTACARWANYMFQTAYNEPQRHFHSMKHIDDMFAKVQKHRLKMTFEQSMAVWAHDLVYIPGAQDNEEQSCVKYREWYATTSWLTLLPQSILETTCEIIMDTKTHVPTLEESKLVLDLDMSILGDPTDKFNIYCEDIRKEFEFVPLEIYKAKRKEVLIDFLQRAERKELFFVLGDIFNEQAKINLTAEINRL